MTIRATPAERARSAALAAALELALLIALVVALRGRGAAPREESPKLFALARPAPVAQPVRPRHRAARSQPAAAPRALRSRPVPLVARPPIVPLPLPPPPLVVAPIAGPGAEPNAGAADTPGPGTGAGGEGEGPGAGRNGNGDGGGGRSRETPPRQIGGRLSTRDLPDRIAEAGGGSVGVRYVVAVDGRVPGCLVTRSSGDPELDALTCDLIRKRFRFAPARDGAGRAVPSTIVESHEFIVTREDRPPD